ncbi:hypothetical protein [Brevibacillus sp. SYP-B805]|uniref:hypothetical protein n=1 Tax=Brevibacillus sp. SYP-B805 TaxID=1578199 RepID=UPI0032168737
MDLTSLTWDQFWMGVLYFMLCGTLFSLGLMRLLQKRIRSGIVLMAGFVISLVVIFSMIVHAFLG